MIFNKAASGALDYQFDWSEWLNGDTIATSSFTAYSGITIDSIDNDTTTTTVWLSGGTAPNGYTVENTITTAAGRTAKRSIRVQVI